ncbi:SAM-dependent methyltransferase [Helicobacter monodelphidis]|uniref:class I SAM-dependent methyltransferase n=1 Tax=Helicobacter sp. 15-1451 TaxID=2004995 RepID=UPI000DCE99B2|nr:methyltransferase domain-containing protein [Helicobacter sp. 15-1451]RAX57993.1 SAM-dependent methyltransferase [Helicobacter sp. 15-1451]
MLIQYIKHPKRTGALCSSSKSLSYTITENIGLEQAEYIAEIGPGTGAFTNFILKKKSPQATFFAVEINDEMASKLRHKNIDVETGSAEHLAKMMEKRNIPHLDAIVSGIPWALLGQKEQDRLLMSIYNGLKEGGYFATFAYALPTLAIPSLPARKFRKKIYDIFSEVKTSKIMWQNIPPAFVYYCKK